MIYSLYPAGHMSRYQYFIDLFQQSFLSGMSGLGTMLGQIPEYHIFNLIERIVNGIHSSVESSAQSSVESSAQPSVESSVQPSVESSTQSTMTASTTPALSTATSTAVVSRAAPGPAREAENDESASDSSDEQSKSLSEKVLMPPYITNTVAHASECDLMVQTSCSDES